MRALIASLLLTSPLAWAQRTPDVGAPSGNGYSVVTARATPRPPAPAAAPPAAPPQTVLSTSSAATVSTIGGRPTSAEPVVTITTVPSGGPRGPGVEVTQGRTRMGTGTPPASAPTVRASAGGVTYVMGANGVIVAMPIPTAAQDPDAGVDDPTLPTTGSLFGGPRPGPAVAYMGVPVQSRRPPPAPPLAPGAVRPGHTLPGSVAAPPAGATPWIPHSTSGFQLGPRGTPSEIGGYGFQMPSAQNANPGTIRNSP